MALKCENLLFFNKPLNYLMITIFKLRITTEIKCQQEMNFFWIIRTAQFIRMERRRFNENNKIMRNFIFSFSSLFFSLLLIFNVLQKSTIFRLKIIFL